MSQTKYPLKQLLKETWSLISPYWRSSERWRALGLFAVVVGLSLGLVYLNVLFNHWNNHFYDALQKHDAAAFWHQLFRFGWLAALFIAAGVYQTYLRQMLEIRWRRWLTEHYVARWTQHQAYYRLQLAHSDTDNPDQRISDDLNSFVSQTLNLFLGLMNSVVTLFSFIVILWGLSGVIHMPWFGHSSVAIYGSMVWAGLVYAVVGTWLTHRIGRPLIHLNFNQQRYEADFRFSLVRLRENAEGVALYKGEMGEREHFRQRFSHIVGNWWNLMRRQKRLGWFTTGYDQVANVYPFLVAGPRYLAGAFTLGQLMQTASAFGQVQSSLSFFVDSYTNLASWRAVVQRLTSFHQAMEKAHEAALSNQGLEYGPAEADELKLEDLVLTTPAGEPLLEPLNLHLRPGERVLVMGPSGAGKSTLFRVIAGIWPFARGRVRRPDQGEALFLPQKPYLPIGTLRDALAYPDSASDIGDERLQAALAQVGLPAMARRLGEEAHWSNRLSPGEQQRIAFARALVVKPRWLFLDEATAALDEATERRLYGLLNEQLPDATIVSIGHRSSLVALHDRVINLEPPSSPLPEPAFQAMPVQE